MVSMSTTPHPLDSTAAPGKEEARPMRLRQVAAPMALPLGDDEDEGPRRVRKPYTITKSRESWTEPEHDKFLEALQLSVSHLPHPSLSSFLGIHLGLLGSRDYYAVLLCFHGRSQI
jgi:hypothetical protein